MSYGFIFTKYHEGGKMDRGEIYRQEGYQKGFEDAKKQRVK